jgi:hypothetical protein
VAVDNELHIIKDLGATIFTSKSHLIYEHQTVCRPERSFRADAEILPDLPYEASLLILVLNKAFDKKNTPVL